MEGEKYMNNWKSRHPYKMASYLGLALLEALNNDDMGAAKVINGLILNVKKEGYTWGKADGEEKRAKPISPLEVLNPE